MGALCIQEKMCLHGVTINQKNISIFQKQDKNPLVQNGCAEKNTITEKCWTLQAYM